ncbi:hypothetical protein GFV12_06875 [Desulfurobacterium thermolithotrophum]|uniref:hypothetical protein n=1 Tax=Desulfurobacterium thermolithotrophum TaxID=64160 RepID=UPI0013D5A898|nr:hypothetical protein [Desulfurobacterium thermolithotrophum]
MEISLERDELKEIFKEAITELIYERKEDLAEIMLEILEDYFMGKAIEEGLLTKNVTKEEIQKILKS